MNNTEITVPNRSAAITALAVVGFVALIGAGMWLAVYSTRYIPSIVNGIGTAAVSLGSVFVPSPTPSLAVVPATTTPTTISFDTPTATSTPEITATSTVATTTATTTAATPVKSPATTGTGSSSTHTIVVGPKAPVYSGLPDLATTITTIGYLTTASADSFVGGSTVPSGDRAAVKFTIKNVGTNWSGTWRFTASIPTRTSYTYTSDLQQSLAPGESIDYTLGFDDALTGTGETVTVTANFDHAVIDANANNDTAFANLTIQ